MLTLQSDSHTMDKFDRLVQRAAKNKRQDIINRYGHEGCAKLLAKRKQEGKNKDNNNDPKFIKKNYESTIRNLLEAWETSPRGGGNNSCSSSSKPPKKNFDNIIDSAWSWNLAASDKAVAGQEGKPQIQKQKTNQRRYSRGVVIVEHHRSRRHSLEV
jgi:hypothetical protein